MMKGSKRTRLKVGSLHKSAPGFCIAVFVLALVTASSALGSSDGRTFELVSNPYTAGFGAPQIKAVAANGESVMYRSPGTFAGAPEGLSGLDEWDYMASRGTLGWSTLPEMPPAALLPQVSDRDASPSLGRTLALGYQGSNYYSYLEATQEVFMVHDTGTPDVPSNWTALGVPMETVNNQSVRIQALATSDDFCHLFLSPQVGQALLPGAPIRSGQLYEMASGGAGCHGEPAELRLVGVTDAGNPVSPSCPVSIGSAEPEFDAAGEAQRGAGAISADGSDVFFVTCIKNSGSHYQLFARLGGARTIEVSRPIDPGLERCGEEEIPCQGASARPNAHFDGASEDGSRVFFNTTAQLVGGDGDSTQNLYMAQIGCVPGNSECAPAAREVTSLTRVSVDLASGQGAEVQGVLGVAPDGRRVYFVARGVLSEGPNVEGQAPVQGADNLYVYEAPEGAGNGRVAFVAELCSGLGQSGGASGVVDQHCSSAKSDSPLWKNAGEDQMAGPSGEFLVFATYAQLVAGDTDNAMDVYRYDAVTGLLDRVSVGEAGYGADGNCSEETSATTCDATIKGADLANGSFERNDMDSRTISENGSRIVFATAQRLSRAAVNGLENVYEWYQAPGSREGTVSLLSGGGGETSIEDYVMSPSGDDVFFVATQQLTTQNLDGLSAVYDARLNGGFPLLAQPTEPCEGDGCQGPLTNPAPLLIPGSASQAPGENLPLPPPLVSPTSRAKSAKPSRAKSRGKVKRKRAKRAARVAGRGSRRARANGRKR